MTTMMVIRGGRSLWRVGRGTRGGVGGRRDGAMTRSSRAGRVRDIRGRRGRAGWRDRGVGEASVRRREARRVGEESPSRWIARARDVGRRLGDDDDDAGLSRRARVRRAQEIAREVVGWRMRRVFVVRAV